MILFTQISVPMTEFKIDVMIGGTKEEYDLVEEGRYALRPDEDGEHISNSCATIYTGSRGIIASEKIFQLKLAVMPLENVPMFIHELWHLMWKIPKVITDFELVNEAPWAAYMIEQISRDIINAKYEELNLEYGE